MREEYIFVTILLSIAGAAAIVIGTVMYFKNQETRTMLEHGYEWRAKSEGDWYKPAK